ncbi:hypothetical protein ZWY2020_054841 [Hordeum vulgare]|nr:hypothetical protein ZWY2020_054841 [Hordeum vulgare]
MNPRCPFLQPFLANNDAMQLFLEGPYSGRVLPECNAYAESVSASDESVAASVLTEATSVERASAAASRVRVAVMATVTSTTTMAANTVSVQVCVADVALSRFEAIHDKIEDSHPKIFKDTSVSNRQPMYEKVVETMVYLLSHEITERELEMQDAVEI